VRVSLRLLLVIVLYAAFLFDPPAFREVTIMLALLLGR
jgi:hypothetical protein